MITPWFSTKKISRTEFVRCTQKNGASVRISPFHLSVNIESQLHLYRGRGPLQPRRWFYVNTGRHPPSKEGTVKEAGRKKGERGGHFPQSCFCCEQVHSCLATGGPTSLHRTIYLNEVRWNGLWLYSPRKMATPRRVQPSTSSFAQGKNTLITKVSRDTLV